MCTCLNHSVPTSPVYMTCLRPNLQSYLVFVHQCEIKQLEVTLLLTFFLKGVFCNFKTFLLNWCVFMFLTGYVLSSYLMTGCLFVWKNNEYTGHHFLFQCSLLLCSVYCWVATYGKVHDHHLLYNTFPIQCSPHLRLCSVYWLVANHELPGNSLYITWVLFLPSPFSLITSIHKLIIWIYGHVLSYFKYTHKHTHTQIHKDAHYCYECLFLLHDVHSCC